MTVENGSNAISQGSEKAPPPKSVAIGRMLSGGVKFPPLLLPSTLLLLKEEPTHGYLLLRKLADIGVVDAEMDPSILYRMLRRLEEEGMAVSDRVDEGRGPTRKVYRLTDKGNEVLSYWSPILEKAAELIKWFRKRYRELE